MSGSRSSPLPPSAEAFRTALDLFAAGLEMMRQTLRRQHPQAEEEEIERWLADWLRERPGAEGGDCPGRVVDPADRSA